MIIILGDNSIDGMLLFNLTEQEILEVMGNDARKSDLLWSCISFIKKKF